jgi:hypothetical protein
MLHSIAMSVRCAKCGEELLGAVNRCWRCGQTLKSHVGPADLPPVRRPPIASLRDEAASLASPAARELALERQDSQSAVSTPAVEVQVVPQNVLVRRGSPFAPVASLAETPAVRTSYVAYPAERVAAQATATRVSGLVAGVLAACAIFMAFVFPLGAIAVALAALAFAIWSIYSPNRRLGIASLVFCCIALAIAMLLGMLDLYYNLYGDPFAPLPNPPDAAAEEL